MGAEARPARGEAKRLRPAPAWAHRSDLIELAPPGRGPAPIDVVVELQQRIYRYCWGFDERRTDILADCFTEDGSWEASVMGETRVGPFAGREAVVAWLTGFWPHQRDQRRHLFLNFIVDDVSEDRAIGYAYLQLMRSSNAATRLEAVGLYRFRFRRQNDGWRIESLLAGFDSPYWKQEVADMEPWVKQLFGINEGAPATDHV